MIQLAALTGFANMSESGGESLFSSVGSWSEDFSSKADPRVLPYSPHAYKEIQQVVYSIDRVRIGPF